MSVAGDPRIKRLASTTTDTGRRYIISEVSFFKNGLLRGGNKKKNAHNTFFSCVVKNRTRRTLVAFVVCGSFVCCTTFLKKLDS